jgi:hypothetical protein
VKILWVSPEGTGSEIAIRLIHGGHTVVTWGLEGLPAVDRAGLAPFAQAADLVVVDGTFPLVPTRRSWRPSTESLFFDELRRHHDVLALGPTPTVDLLVGDARYLRKIMGRFGIPSEPVSGTVSDLDEPWSSGAWFLGNRVVPDGPYLASLVPLFKSVGFRGWFELTGLVTPDGPVVTSCNANWPPDTLPEGREAAWLKEMAA